MAAKTKPAKKPVAKAAKKPAKPVAKAKAPVRKPPGKAAKPAAKPTAKPAAKPKAAAKSKPVATKANARPAPAKAKSALPHDKAKGAAAKTPAAPPKPAPGPVKRLTNALVKLVKPVAKAPVATPKPRVEPAPAPVVSAPGTSRKTAGKAMPSTPTPRAVAAAAPKPAPAPRDIGVRATAVKSNRPPPNSEPNLTSLPERVDLPEGYRPKQGEEYMSAMQLEYFRQKLTNWRAELVEESKQTIDNLREEVRDVGDDAERATRETENSLELRTRDRYRKLISKIDKALKRIDDGAYGYCEETGEEIGIERLEARPIATLCLDAQERWEHRQKLMGD